MGDMKIQSGIFEGNCHSDDWNLLEGEGARINDYEVKFDTPFDEAPTVHVAPIGLDIFNNDNTRFAISVEGVDKEGFKLRYKTWVKTRIWYIKINWLAIGK